MRHYFWLVLCISVVLPLWALDRERFKAELITRTLERDTAVTAAKGWKERAAVAETTILALQEEVTSCLERERDAAASAEEWRTILAEAKSRDMAPEETGKVPDAPVRRALFDALDRPL